MKITWTFLFFSMASFFFSHAQVTGDSTEILRRAKIDVEHLCSDSLAGRGYIGEGHQKAALYLAKRFREIGLPPIKEQEAKSPYFQDFVLQINLASQLQLSIDGKDFEVGEHVIVNKFSGSGEVSARIIDVGYGLEPSKKAEGKVVLLRAGWPAEIANSSEEREKYKELSKTVDRCAAYAGLGAKAIIVIQKKLTAGFTRDQAPIPILELKETALPKRYKKAKMKVESRMTSVQSQNVIGYIPGKVKPDSALILSAHYDHLGKLESAIFTGANDNASGTSMLLSMAEYFQEHPLDYTLVFIAFGGEETGLVGSNFYVNTQPIFPLKRSKFILNLDLMGNGVDGITAVGGKDHSEAFDKLKKLNEELEAVPVVRARPNAPNSDHFFFLQNGVPGFFIYTLGGPPHYHDVNDRPENLEYSRYVNVRELLIRFLESM